MDGYYRLQNVDLYRLLCRLNAGSAFNIIDTVVLDESVRDGGHEDPRHKMKAVITNLYGKIRAEDSSNDEDFDDYVGSSSAMQPHGYLEADESGFPGLEAPMG